jgi:hypothetical protein
MCFMDETIIKKEYKMKGLTYGFVFAASVFCAPLAQADVAPSIVGSWKVTFYLENTRATGAIQCIVMSSVPGKVAGVPTSGTWTSPTFPGWRGEWIQLGDHVRWFGTTSSLATTESGNASNRSHMEGVSFNHYNKTSNATSTAGSWHAVRVSSCSTFDVNATDGDDPSKK